MKNVKEQCDACGGIDELELYLMSNEDGGHIHLCPHCAEVEWEVYSSQHEKGFLE